MIGSGTGPRRERFSPERVGGFLYEAAANGVRDDVGVRAEAGLDEDPRSVRAHGLHAEIEDFRNLRGALSGGDEAEHFEFTGGEPFVRRVGRTARTSLHP